MFTAAHITLLQVYPFPEPVFQPASLARLGLWTRLTQRNRRNQRHLDLFNQRASLRSWLRNGNPVAVPNLGVMKALRKPDLPYDRFYKPFFQANLALDEHLRLPEGPLPFYPIQILLQPDQAELRSNAEDKAAWEAALGQPLKTWSVTPMLVVYPAGCISAQYRLFIEPVTPVTSEALRHLLKQWHQVAWQIRYKQANRQVNGHGPAALLDNLAQRFHQELVDGARGQPLDLAARQTFTLVNVQGSLHDAATNTRRKDAQYALTQLAGVAYDAAPAATVWGAREAETIPWLLMGKHCATLAVDDAVRAHARYRTDGKILEGRRALRNRALSTLEMALALRVLYTWYGDWLIAEQRAWSLEPLVGRWQRFTNIVRQPKLDARIYGTLFYEIAYVQEHLAQADPKNRELWLALFKAALQHTDQTEGELAQIIERVRAAGEQLLADVRERQQFQFERAQAALDVIAHFVDWSLSSGDGNSAVPTTPPP